MGFLPDDASRRSSLAREGRRIGALVAIVLAIRLLHSSTHEPEAIWVGLLLRLYYIPILVSAYWYGPFGGLLMAVASSLAYAPHLRENPALEEGRYAEIVFFHVIGLAVGLLAAAQRRVAERHRRAAATLEHANQELRASYEQLQRADRLKALGEVAAGLAHEVRHPLASIRGALEIIESRSASGTPEAEFSRLAMAEVHRLDNLVAEFLRYARPRAPDLRLTSLHDVLTPVLALLAVEADHAGIALVIDRRERLPSITLDALQIQQVLFNVILNAIQASGQGSSVRIREYTDDEDAIIEVTDEGGGIPPEQIAQIFAPFFTTKESGTGLGLAIAQRIVFAHHGRIDVTSSQGRGTSVRIRLPIQPGDRIRRIAVPLEAPA